MAAAPNKYEQSDVILDPIQTEIATPESVSWLSFDGRQGFSSHEFVQKVHRTAFQHVKQRDDEWVADFAVTCFSGEALEWYIGLDEETQTSWRRLRAALIQRWPIESGTTPSGVDPANIPAPAPAMVPPHPLPYSSKSGSLGIIKVQAVFESKFFGYVAFDAAGTCIIQSDATRALVIGRPQQVHPEAPCQISIVGPEAVQDSIAHKPYLGLFLLRQLGRNPDAVPSEIPYEKHGNSLHVWPPVPSALCTPPRNPSGVHPLATWYISPSSQDPPGPWRKRTSFELLVPAAAVFAWTFDPITLELATTWLMPDGTLYDLAAYTDGVEKNFKLHMHRPRDVLVLQAEERSLFMFDDFCDQRVRLYFTPI